HGQYAALGAAALALACWMLVAWWGPGLDQLRADASLPSPVLALAFSPDGEVLAGGDEKGGLTLWDSDDLTERHAGVNSRPCRHWPSLATANGCSAGTPATRRQSGSRTPASGCGRWRRG